MNQVSKLLYGIMLVVLCAGMTGCPLLNQNTNAPTADFEAYLVENTNPLNIQFYDLSEPSGTIIAWSWNFGDGGRSTLQDPIHAYNAPGVYTVTLTVQSLGGSSTVSYDYTISGGTPNNDGPTAGFSAAPTGGPAPLLVVFTDQSLPGTDAITEWSWDFGDGNKDTTQNPTHTYQTPGVYSVTLKVTTAKGTNTKISNNYITVANGSDPNQDTIDPPSMCSIPEVTFTQGVNSFNSQRDHEVQLTPYNIGTYEITNEEYCAVLNWAMSHNRILRSGLSVYSNPVHESFGTGNQKELYSLDTSDDYRSKIVFDSIYSSYKVQVGFEKYPVVSTTWYGAVAFCNWLSEMKGLTPSFDMTSWTLTDAESGGYRLPTESEWECAAAVKITGGTADEYSYPIGVNSISSSDVPKRMNIQFHYNEILPVGFFDGHNAQTIFSTSPLGCYDMAGNVAEWCIDWYESTYYTYCDNLGTVIDPLGPTDDQTSQKYRVVRGGSFRTSLSGVHTAERYKSTPETKGSGLGFRIVQK